MFRFNDDWMQEEIFHGWLVKVTNDESRAYCRYCAIVLRAHKSDLTTHAATQKHLGNAKLAEESGSSNAPISVQIVSNDGEEEAGIDNNDPDPDPEYTPGTEDVDDSDCEKKPVIRNIKTAPTSRRKSSKLYSKKYRPAWEEEEEFKGWLQPYPDDNERAFCRICKTILRAHKHDLSCHARTIRHLKHLTAYETGVELIDDGTLSKKPKFQVTDITIADNDHDDQGSILGIEMDLPNDKKINQPPPKAIPVPKVARRESPKPLSKKRARINAADVVAAIENNEFTGYELLHIVKKAVPKL